MDTVQNHSFIHLHKRIYFSLFDPSQSAVMALHELNNGFVIVPFNRGFESGSRRHFEILERGPISLAEIYSFDCMMRAVARQNPDSKLVVCTGALTAVRARTALLVGSHMLLSLGVSLKNTMQAFAPLHDLLRCPIKSDDECAWLQELTAENCWGALSTALGHRWIEFGRPFGGGDDDGVSLSVEEYLHYSE
jgi:hypothetical protein